MINFVLRIKRGDPRVLLELSLFDFCSQFFKMNFVKPTLFSFSYDYYTSARMVASQLNHQIILLLKRPLTHYWTSPLILDQINPFGLYRLLIQSALQKPKMLHNQWENAARWLLVLTLKSFCTVMP